MQKLLPGITNQIANLRLGQYFKKVAISNQKYLGVSWSFLDAYNNVSVLEAKLIVSYL